MGGRFSGVDASSAAIAAKARGGELQSQVAHSKAALESGLAGQAHDRLVLELEDAAAILADDVAVVGVLMVVRIVELAVPAEVHLAENALPGQEGQCSIDRGPGDGGVLPPRPGQQLLRSEMLPGLHDRRHDRAPLRGEANAALSEVRPPMLSNPLLGGGPHGQDYSLDTPGVNETEPAKKASIACSAVHRGPGGAIGKA